MIKSVLNKYINNKIDTLPNFPQFPSTLDEYRIIFYITRETSFNVVLHIVTIFFLILQQVS